MDYTTYESLLRRVEYLELVAERHAGESFLVQLLRISEKLDNFIKAKYPQLLRVIELLKQYRLWHLEATPHAEQKAAVLASLDDLERKLELDARLASFDHEKLLRDPSVYNLARYHDEFDQISRLLLSEVLPRKHSVLLARSMAAYHDFLVLINEYNKTVVQLAQHAERAETRQRVAQKKAADDRY